MADKLKCPKGHAYVMSTFAEGAYKAGWKCERCSSSHGADVERHFCQACSSDICLQCRPQIPEQRAMPTYVDPDTNVEGPLLLDNGKSGWRCPKHIQDLIDVNFTYVSPEHKALIIRSLPWTVKALRHASEDQNIKKWVRRLLSTFQYTQCLSWAQPSWPTLMARLDEHMAVIGDELDAFYKSQNLREVLGEFKPNMLPDSNYRQDCPGGLKSPACFATAAEQGQSNPMWRLDPSTLANELAYIHYERLVATAITEHFRKAMDELLSPWVVGGKFVCGGIKGYERMQNKLKSFDDHWRDVVPRPAENVDVVRGMAVFETAGDMRLAMERLQEEYGPFVKFKNGMAWPDQQAKDAKHLRLVLASIRFSPRKPDTNAAMTFGDLCDSVDVQRLWDAYSSRDPPATQCIERGVVGAGVWHRSVAMALKWMRSSEFQYAKVTMVCEVQMLLEKYRLARHKMHEMYKVRRADNAARLHADFVATSLTAHADDVARKDSGQVVDNNRKWTPGLTIAHRLRHAVYFGEFRSSSNPMQCNEGHRMKIDFFVTAAASTAAAGDDVAAAVGVAAAGDATASPWTCAVCTKESPQSQRRHHCVTCDWNVCYECEPLATPDTPFVEQLRTMSGQLQKLNLEQCASLVSIACKKGHLEIVQTLLSLLVQFELAEAVTCLNVSSGGGYHFPLWYAASCPKSASRLELVKTLVSAKASVNHTTPSGVPALYEVARVGYLDAVKLLLDMKADLNKMSSQKTETPLYNACYRGHDDVARTLLEHKADFNIARAASNAGPLYTASENGHVTIVEALVAMKAELDAVTTNNSTPMYIAAQNGHLEIIHILASAKANPHLGRSKDSCTALYAAADKGYVEIVEYLANYIATTEQWNCKCEAGCACGINILVQGGQWTPVAIAAYRGFLPCVRALVELGVNKKALSQALTRCSADSADIRALLQSRLAQL